MYISSENGYLSLFIIRKVIVIIKIMNGVNLEVL